MWIAFQGLFKWVHFVSVLSCWIYDSHNSIERTNKRLFFSSSVDPGVYVTPLMHAAVIGRLPIFLFVWAGQDIFLLCFQQEESRLGVVCMFSLSLLHSVSVSLFSWLIRTTSIHFKAHRAVQLCWAAIWRSLSFVALFPLSIFYEVSNTLHCPDILTVKGQ